MIVPLTDRKEIALACMIRPCVTSGGWNKTMMKDANGVTETE